MYPLDRKLVASLFLLGLLLFIISLAQRQRRQDGPDSGKDTIHPTSENIPVITDPRFVLRPEASEQGAENNFIDMTEYEEIATIGLNEGNPHEMFGNIVDVATNYAGTLFVLDSEYNQVRVFDYDGSHISTFGGPGEGPGEFLYPWKVLLANIGRTVAVHSINPFVHVFERQDATTFQLRSSFPDDVQLGESGCAMNGYFYYLGFSNELDGVIHKYTLEGDRVASFGAPYKSSSPIATQVLSDSGYLACSEQHAMIAHIRSYVPVVTGYKETGEAAWQVLFPDFKPSRVEVSRTEDGRESIFLGNPVIGENSFVDLFTDSSGDYFYVKHSTHVGPREDGSIVVHDVFRVDARTGEGSYLGNAPLGQMHTDLDDPYVITAWNYPFPRVKIYKVREAHSRAVNPKVPGES